MFLHVNDFGELYFSRGFCCPSTRSSEKLREKNKRNIGPCGNTCVTNGNNRFLSINNDQPSRLSKHSFRIIIIIIAIDINILFERRYVLECSTVQMKMHKSKLAKEWCFQLDRVA